MLFCKNLEVDSCCFSKELGTEHWLTEISTEYPELRLQNVASCSMSGQIYLIFLDLKKNVSI